MIATTYDSNLGGRDFDKVLMDHFHQEIKAKYNMDAYSSNRARLRLRAECEKLKKLMSSNASQIPFNIECLMNDRDFSSNMKRYEIDCGIIVSLMSGVNQGFFFF
jgi:molecular chaperone DnaK (HSP70)